MYLSRASTKPPAKAVLPVLRKVGRVNLYDRIDNALIGAVARIEPVTPF